jgi:hypothetical protein
MSHWVRVRSNLQLGAYEIDLAVGNLGEPEWPDLGISDILKIAFRDRLIDSADHLLIKRLRGEI